MRVYLASRALYLDVQGKLYLQVEAIVASPGELHMVIKGLKIILRCIQ